MKIRDLRVWMHPTDPVPPHGLAGSAGKFATVDAGHGFPATMRCLPPNSPFPKHLDRKGTSHPIAIRPKFGNHMPIRALPIPIHLPVITPLISEDIAVRVHFESPIGIQVPIAGPEKFDPVRLQSSGTRAGPLSDNNVVIGHVEMEPEPVAIPQSLEFCPRRQDFAVPGKTKVRQQLRLIPERTG